MALGKIIDLIKKDNKRSIRNYLLDPQQQLKLALYVCLNTLFVVTAACYFVYSMYFPLMEGLILTTGVNSGENFQLLSENTTAIFYIVSAFTLFYLVVTTAVVVWYSHRFVGPEVAFRRHVKSLKEGKASSRVKLRPGDAFTDLADDLNQLAETLEAKS